MNDILDNIAERPTSHKVIAWVLTLLIVFGLFWQYFYKSRLQEADKLQEKVENLEQEVTHKKRVVKNLPVFKREVEKLEIQLKFALQELPDKREIPDLLTSISGLARDAGLEVDLFKPAKEMKKEFYAEVPVSISVSGTYHQVATFFDEVGHLPRIVNITDIEVHEPVVSDEKVDVNTNCRATTFRYLDEEERKEQEELKKNKGKKRRR